MEDRKYQNDAISGIQWAVENGAQRVMLVAPPGAGKTKIASDYFSTVTGHVVAFSHRKEIRDQITRAFAVTDYGIMASAKSIVHLSKYFRDIS